nr:DUF2235 domain-containing protein [Phyllobacterium zundukense]
MYDRYKRANDKTIRQLIQLAQEAQLQSATLEEKWMLKYSIAAPIKMVGVWDTVGALGIPFWSIQGLSRSTFQFLHTGLRVPIENGYHALAIDEHRASFSPTLWSVKSTTQAAPRLLSNVEQRWFVGAHANVGGRLSQRSAGANPVKLDDGKST